MHTHLPATLRRWIQFGNTLSISTTPATADEPSLALCHTSSVIQPSIACWYSCRQSCVEIRQSMRPY
ncbi:hypothetical protein IF2G_02844 [Cordyceps javanica]|nr:hypothetical protein IF2G_02844 [Cordyceps javanica]